MQALGGNLRDKEADKDNLHCLDYKLSVLHLVMFNKPWVLFPSDDIINIVCCVTRLGRYLHVTIMCDENINSVKRVTYVS